MTKPGATTDLRPLLDSTQAAEALGISINTLGRDRLNGTLGVPFIKLGRSIRYHIDDLNDWVAKKRLVPPTNAPESGNK